MRTGINLGAIVDGLYVTTPRFVAIKKPSPGAIENVLSDGRPCSKPIAEISHPNFKREQWYKTDDGYFVRYLPNSYKQTKVQVYVPKEALDSTADYIVFNPASLVVVPANSNAQRLGIGGPMIEVAKSVIKIITRPRVKKQPEAPKPVEAPRPSGHPGARD